MRTLIYVPIVHTEPELGTLAAKVGKAGQEILGTDRWQIHKKTVECFWKQIAKFFEKLDVFSFKIYQDSLPAGGALGLKIIKENAKTGSLNHKIILELVKRGAKVVKTEDGALLKKEYFLVKDLSEASNILGGIIAYLRLKRRQGKLLFQRDKFVAKRIDKTLKPGETGIVFLGANHNVVSILSTLQMKVIKIKEPGKIRAYWRELFSGRNNWYLSILSKYLTSPVKIEL